MTTVMHKLEEMLINSTWRFGRGNGQVIAPVLQLLPRGVIGAYTHQNERRWTIRNGVLRFLSTYGVTTAVFDHVDYEGALPRRMAGQVRFAPSIQHVLERIAMPNGAGSGQHAKPEFLTRLDRPRRQNLVVLRANAASLHTQWASDISEEDRNWDLCISWYDQTLSANLGPHEYLTHQAADRKFTAIYALFYPGSPLWNYDYIWLPDDDLLTSKRDINRLFEVCYRYDLLLAQPSVTAQSFASHPVTRQDERFWLRFSMFVEIMCPIFSNQALRTCLENYGEYGVNICNDKVVDLHIAS